MTRRILSNNSCLSSESISSEELTTFFGQIIIIIKWINWTCTWETICSDAELFLGRPICFCCLSTWNTYWTNNTIHLYRSCVVVIGDILQRMLRSGRIFIMPVLGLWPAIRLNIIIPSRFQYAYIRHHAPQLLLLSIRSTFLSAIFRERQIWSRTVNNNNKKNPFDSVHKLPTQLCNTIRKWLTTKW